MDQGKYFIDELCSLTGFSRRTIHYYVQNGLVDPPAGRGRGGFYSDSHVGQLARIRALQEQGYRLDAIKGMIARTTGPAPSPAKAGDAAPASILEESAHPPTSKHPGVQQQAWKRYTVAPGVELHLSFDAERKLGADRTTALDALRSIIDREGGLNG